MQLTKSSNTCHQGLAARALSRLVYKHYDNQSAAAAAGAVHHLMQLTKSSNADLQERAVDALGFLVFDHRGNQSDAAAAGAVPHLMQLAKSSNAPLQRTAVTALGCLIYNHNDNQSAAAAAGAVPHLMQLTKSSTYGLHQGCQVQLQGLLSREDLNGCFGYVCGVCDGTSQRWPVRVKMPEGGKKDMLLKADNLVCTQQVMARDAKGGLRASLQEAAITALAGLVINHHVNQSAAAAEGAVLHLMQLTKSNNAVLQQQAVDALGSLVADHTDNQSAAGAAGVVECMCNLLSSDHVPTAVAAANTLSHLSSLADNARRAVSMGALVLLLQLKARSGGNEWIELVLAKLAQVPTAPAA